jgi:hypothetical protein
MLWLGLLLMGVPLAVANLRGTRRIWRSGVYERGQLYAQSLVIWAIPGSVFAVVHVLKEDRPGRAVNDPTAINPTTPHDTITGIGSNVGAP